MKPKKIKRLTPEMTPEELGQESGLLSRLERAQEGSRELDTAICMEHVRDCSYAEDRACPGLCDSYTTRLDAARSLIPEGCSADIQIGPHDLASNAIVYTRKISKDDKGRRVTTYIPHEGNPVINSTVKRKTAALSLAIAAIKAEKGLR